MPLAYTSQESNQVDLYTLENKILPNVMKPARYVGIEQGAYRKSFEDAKVTMAFAFPDLYEIGISNYGVKLFYSLINQHPDYMCDRVYAPAPDMKEKLAEHDMALYGVESMVPLKAFDVLAFTLQYELNYTTILGLLESAKIPFRTADRQSGEYPLLIAGGPGSANPMPLAPFFDAFIIGDGEEVLIDMLAVIRQGKEKGQTRQQLLHELSLLDGIYIPGVTPKAYKRIVDIAEHPIDIAPLIPSVQAVHDRVTIEARRGCDRMCRFCQPCFINLPVREQSVEQIKKSALSEIEKTGYEECSLLSLSIADYSYFKPMILEVAEALEEEGISLSLPSQRADRFSIDVAEAIQKVRKSTLTFAPEAGTKRLRDVINKNLTDQEILNAVTSSYKAGWNKVKLYFIIGLPTETLDDLDGIVATVKMLQDACNEIKRDSELSFRKHLDINVTLSNFVPKPHTPFQWFPQDTMEILHSKIRYIKEQFHTFRGVKLNFTDPEISKLEAFISRGGPELADVLELAYQKGAYLDAWDDVNNFQKWFDAITERGPELGIEGWEQYTRERCTDPDEALPWDPIDVGLDKAWLKDEYERAKAAAATVPCFEACSTCGVCANYSTWPKFIEPPAYMLEANPQINPQEPESEKQADTDDKTPLVASDEHKLKRVSKALIRIKLEKQGKLKFISHLDWLRMIHRTVIRAKIPVAYSQGFNPKPKISFGPALPLFSESTGEFIDIELSASIERLKEVVIDPMNALLPEGGQVSDAWTLPLYSPSIDKSIETLTYEAIPVFDEWESLDSNAFESQSPEAAKQTEGGEATSFKQATCQVSRKRYTEDDRLQWLLQKTVSHLDAYAKGEALNYQLPLEFASKPSKSSSFKKGQTRQTEAPTDADAKRILNLTPYLADFRVLPSGRIQFKIIRRQSPNPDASPAVSATAQADSGQSIAENKALAKPGAAPAAAGVKPIWVLNLIDPNIKWSLIRTDISLDTKSQPSTNLSSV